MGERGDGGARRCAKVRGCGGTDPKRARAQRCGWGEGRDRRRDGREADVSGGEGCVEMEGRGGGFGDGRWEGQGTEVAVGSAGLVTLAWGAGSGNGACGGAQRQTARTTAASSRDAFMFCPDTLKHLRVLAEGSDLSETRARPDQEQVKNHGYRAEETSDEYLVRAKQVSLETRREGRGQRARIDRLAEIGRASCRERV